jgi:hypothetical protein
MRSKSHKIVRVIKSFVLCFASLSSPHIESIIPLITKNNTPARAVIAVKYLIKFPIISMIDENQGVIVQV